MEEFNTLSNLAHNNTDDTGTNESIFYEEDSFNQRVYQTALIVDKYYTPLLCLVGMFGNSLSLAVFLTDAKYRSQSASVYLSALAISDTGFLLSLFAVWLEGVLHGGGIITSSDFSCSLVMYIGQVTGFLSVYFTVAFTIERYVAVHCPFSRPRVCTRAKAKKAIACLTVTALVIFSYTWVIAKVIKFPSYSNVAPSDDHGVNLLHGHDPRNESVKHFEIDDITYQNGGLLEQRNSTEIQQSYFTRNIEINEMATQAAQKDTSKEPITLMGKAFGGNNSQHLSHLGNHSSEVAYSSQDFKLVDSRYFCSVPEKYFKVSEIANYFDTAITLIIPVFLITFFNIHIATSVWKLKNKRQSIVASSSKGTNTSCHFNAKNNVVNITVCSPGGKGRVIYRKSSRNPFSQQHITNEKDYETSCVDVNFQNELSEQMSLSNSKERKREEASQSILASKMKLTRSPSLSNRRECTSSRQYTSPEVRVTKTLLLVSSVFLVLNLPSHVIRCAQFIQAVTGTQEGQELLRAFQPWANILFNTNFAVNFLLYCVSGKNFRLSLHSLLIQKLRRGKLSHHRGKVIKRRLNHESRYCSTALTSGIRESCAPTYLRIELETFNANSLNGSSLNLMDEDNEEIVPV